MMDSSQDWSDSIVRQLAEVTATSLNGDHLVLLDQVDLIRSDGEVVSAQQASGYLQMGEWEGSQPCRTVAGCVHPEHVVPATPVAEDEIDQLVSKASRPSLATLYKQARATGLVPASPQGYF